MSREANDLSSALRDYAAERRAADGGPHPDPDELAAYHDERLGEERSAPIREHLALCPDCTDWLLDYADLDRPEPDAARDLSAVAWRRQRDAAWNEIRRRTDAVSGDSAPEPVRRVPAAAAPRRPAARWWAAAVLAAACVILAVLLWQARSEVQRPRPTTVVSLAPAGSGLLRGGAPPDRLVVRPPPGHRLVVQLAYAGVGGEKGFAAEVFPPTGEGAPWVVEVTGRSDEAFAVDLGTDPAPGRYRIALYAVDGGESREVARYGFRIGLAEAE